MKFLKELLGVHIKTTNTCVLLETGEVPLSLCAKKLCIKNWSRIKKDKANLPLIASIQESQNELLPWSELIKTEFFSIGLGGLFSQVRTTKTNICEAYSRRKLDIFYQTAFSQLNDQTSKLRTYGKIKKESGFENYLNRIPVKDRTAFTKLRLSNHKLMIEKMRHQFPKPPEADRRCPFCPDLGEDENTIPDYNTLSVIDKFRILMIESGIIKTTAKYIRTAFEVREFLTKPYKCNG